MWRSAGVYLGKLSPASGQQLSLFEDPQKRLESERLNQAKLDLNERFGRTTVRSATTLLIKSKCRNKGRANSPFL